MSLKGTIYVVDDDRSMRQSLVRLLAGEGFAVEVYASAEAFLEVAGPEMAGCVLLDLRLPKSSGLELQAALAERGCLLPVIFLTGHGDVAASVRAMKGGADDFLQKPVVADELFAAVSSAMIRDANQRRQAQELSVLRERVSRLTARQREVWLRVVQGQLNKQIAAELGIVERTVKIHRAGAMETLHAESTADLVRIAERLGLSRGGEPG